MVAPACSVLGLLVLAGAQPSPGPAPVTTTTTTLDPDVVMRLMVQQSLADAHAQGITTARKGAWVYGDHAELEEISNSVDCHKACEADVDCSHWNFRVTGNTRCDLKTGRSGGYDEDKGDW